MDIGDLFSVKGKTVLVTGGSRGIGEMIASGFLANGAKVIISSRKADACEAAVDRLKSAYGGEVYAIPADLAEVQGAEHLASELAGQESALDVLINNAGATWGATLETFPEAGWDKVMDVNVKGVFFLTQRLLPLLRNSASADMPARIINIGSIDGIRSGFWDNYSYGVSKGAVHHLSTILAARLVKEHILVNAIAPGPFPTPMLSKGVGSDGTVEGTDFSMMTQGNPSGRVGKPDEIAGLAIFLASRASAYMTGQIIACDGGDVVAGYGK